MREGNRGMNVHGDNDFRLLENTFKRGDRLGEAFKTNPLSWSHPFGRAVQHSHCEIRNRRESRDTENILNVFFICSRATHHGCGTLSSPKADSTCDYIYSYQEGLT